MALVCLPQPKMAICYAQVADLENHEPSPYLVSELQFLGRAMPYQSAVLRFLAKAEIHWGSLKGLDLDPRSGFEEPIPEDELPF